MTTIRVKTPEATAARKRLLREAGVEHEYGMPVATLRTLRCRGGGPPFVKIGAAVYYPVDRLDAWLAEREQHSTAERRCA